MNVSERDSRKKFKSIENKEHNDEKMDFFFWWSVVQTILGGP